MATISNARYVTDLYEICQGDIYKNVKYCYIDSEDETSVNIIEYEFPMAIIISQACDVIAMSDIEISKRGKPTKFMPSILMCPIYEKDTAKSGEYVKDIFENNSYTFIPDQVFQKNDYEIAKRDWHYRYHAFAVSVNGVKVIENAIIDFKHYFTVPMSYL